MLEQLCQLSFQLNLSCPLLQLFFSKDESSDFFPSPLFQFVKTLASGIPPSLYIFLLYLTFLFLQNIVYFTFQTFFIFSRATHKNLIHKNYSKIVSYSFTPSSSKRQLNPTKGTVLYLNNYLAMHTLSSLFFLALAAFILPFTSGSALTTAIAANERTCFYAMVDKAGEKVSFTLLVI